MKHKDYVHKLNTYVVNQADAASCTLAEKALPSGQSLYDSLEIFFYIEHEVKHMFTIPVDLPMMLSLRLLPKVVRKGIQPR